MVENVRPLPERLGQDIAPIGGDGDGDGQTTKVTNRIPIALNSAAVRAPNNELPARRALTSADGTSIAK